MTTNTTITNTTPQRKLRGHMPQRPTTKTATSPAHHAELAARLTARDRWLARMLYAHKVLTTQQIVELCYPSTRAANHRLLELYKWRVVDRFQPFRSSGTAPMHYVLDSAGAAALAYEDGIDPRHITYRHEDAIGIAHSLRLAHTVGCNGFFTSLVAASRKVGGQGRLTAWWSESRCMKLFGDIVRPDAYARWREGSHEIEFFLEFDFGTEVLARLGHKLRDYEKLARATDIATPVLVWLPTSRREASARRALAEAASQLDHPGLVPVATSCPELAFVAGDTRPAPAGWLPLATQPHLPTSRARLGGLAQLWPQLDTRPNGMPGQIVSVAPGAVAAPAPAELAPPAPLPPPATPSRRQS